MASSRNITSILSRRRPCTFVNPTHSIGIGARPRADIHVCAQKRRGCTISNRRYKSSIPFLSSFNSDADAVLERAARNAAAFDDRHNLGANDGLFSDWRGRQKSITKSNPMRPYPKERPNLIPPSPRHREDFFPSYAHTGRVGPPTLPPDTVLIHDARSVRRMALAARLARLLLDYVCHPSVARAGRTTQEVDELLRRATLRCGAYPSPLNYAGFPKSVCSSINEVVCHGIPDSRPLATGDVVSFDVSCYVGGVHGDNCGTIVVGDADDGNAAQWDSEQERLEAELLTSWRSANDADDCTASDANSSDATRDKDDSPLLQKDWPSTTLLPHKTQFESPEEEERFITARRLVQAALESRDEGVAACRPGGCLSDIGSACHAVADAYGYGTVSHYRGHGICSDFHCAPFVQHSRNNDNMELVPGMIFTIEPMLTEGSAECGEWSDNWTVVTQDGGRAAQFEHTVLITEDGVKVLTLP